MINANLGVSWQLQSYLRDIVGLVPEHCNKVNIAIKCTASIFWFPSTNESYAYTLL